jgi:DNA-binding transcriptional regulator GbsR (MarR family)
MSNYPHFPGYRPPDTSHQAARKMALWSNGLRVRCLIALLNRPMTASELSDFLSESVLNVSPRVSELKTLGLIHSLGVRRTTTGTATALVWEVVRSALPKEFTGTGQGSLFSD